MKKLLLSFILFAFCTIAFAQAPQKMSYQAMIRNNNNSLIINQTIGMRISIIQGTINGSVVYTERQTPTTNNIGLISIEVGSNPSGLNFNTINWTQGPFFIKTEIDPNGGNNYTINGAAELLSVPYALYADKANSITGILPISNGGTGANNLNDLKNNIGLNLKANLNSPSFSGTPVAPTPVTGTNNAQIATTAFVARSITKANVLPATTTTTGLIKLAGDLGGTADIPVILNDKITTNKIANNAVTNDKISNVNANKISGILSIANGGTGDTSINNLKASLKIDRIDNTADTDKPVSNATQTALNLKLNSTDTAGLRNSINTKLAKSDTVGLSNRINTKLAKSDTAGLSNRINTKLAKTDTAGLSNRINTKLAKTDTVGLSNRINTKLAKTDTAGLSNRINTKAPINNPTFTGTVNGITKTMIGLGNVDNTTDAAKPVSTAAQTALNLKLNSTDTAGLRNSINTKLAKTDTVGLSNRINTKLAKTDTVGLSNRINTKLAKTDTVGLSNRINTKAPINNPTFTGTVNGITKTMIGLGNVDNTTDAAKPVSTGLSNRINTKLAKSDTAGLSNRINTKLAKTDTAGLSNRINTKLAKSDTVGLSNRINTKAPINNPTFTGTVNGITKSMVGLENVDNTTDSAKPISAATQAALDLKFAKADTSSLSFRINNKLTKTDTTSLSIRINQKLNINDTASLRNAINTKLAKADTVGLSNRINTKSPINNPAFTGTVSGISKTMVGLGNVDNTTDVAKPVSTATQTALNLKANLASPTFTGTVSGITKTMVGLGNVDNTTDLLKPISTATQTALNLKANLANPTFTGTVNGITKTMVGLGNVDNTSDLDKPISTATRAALNSKLNITQDQSNTTSNGGAGSTTQWQSFTAGTTGLLSAVEWKIGNPINGASSATAVTLKIYNGEGISGTLLATVSGFTPLSSNLYVNFDLTSDNITVITGNKYTMSITTATVNVGWLDLNSSNSYSRGRAGDDANWDYLFKTYVKAGANESYLPLSGGTVSGAVTFSNAVSGITASMIGLGNVDNTSDAAKPISTATQTALGLKLNSTDTVGLRNGINSKLAKTDTAGLSVRINQKLAKADTTSLSVRINHKLNISDTTGLRNGINSKAAIASPTFTGTPLAPTATAGTSTTQIATTAFVQDAFTSFATSSGSSSSTLTGAIWTSATTGTLNGVGFTMSQSRGSSTSNWDMSSSDFTAAPLSATQNSGEISHGDDWVVTFASPISNLKLYCKYWRTASYVFDQPLTILSSGSGLTSSNSTTVNVSGWGNGIVQFAGPITTLSVNSSADLINDASGQILTFGVGSGAPTSGTGEIIRSANPTFTGTVSGITKAMVGLGSVDNTSDLDKPVSTATQTALDDKLNITDTVGLRNGINSKAAIASPTFTGTPLAPTASAGTNTTQIATTAFVQDAINSSSGNFNASLVGLGNVDNTSDLNKPISTATQTALDLKAPIANPSFTGTVNGITASMVGLSNVDNTSDLNKPISTATQTALDDKLTKTSTRVAIGYVAGYTNQGDYSIAIGSNAAQSGQGTQSVAVGFAASSGADNATALGGYAAAGHVNSTAIGYQAVANAANTIQLGADGVTIPGSTAITNVKTSGTITAGTVTYPNAHNSSAGQVLTTDANGVASWSTPSTPTATTVGLNNVDNTSDLDKPISTATQTALNLKLNATDTAGLRNGINSKLAKTDTTSLRNGINARATIASPTFTGTPTLPTGTIGVTQTAGNNTTALATTAFVQTAISSIANSSSVTEVSDEVSATVGQTSFTLTHAPGANSKVKMYINGIRISNTAYSISGTTLTYDPVNNGAYTLILADRIQFDFSY